MTVDPFPGFSSTTMKLPSADSLCTHGYESLCSTSASKDTRFVSLESIRSKVRATSLRAALQLQANGGCRLDGEADPSANGFSAERALNWLHNYKRSDRRFCYAQVVQREVFAVLSNRLSEARTRALFERIRKHLIQAIETEPKKVAQLEAVKAEMLVEIGRIELILADRFEEWVTLNRNPKLVAEGKAPPLAVSISNRDVDLGGGTCGEDFLKRSVVSSSTGFKVENGIGIHTGMLAVVICPGQLLEAAVLSDSDAEQTLIQVLGHEMGHHIHAVKNRLAIGDQLPDGTKLTTNFAPAYGEMIPCLNKHYQGDLTPSGAREHTLAEIAKRIGHQPTDLDVRLAELTADYWGTRVLDRYLAENNASSALAASAFANSMHRLCYDPKTGARSLKDSSSHPGGRFRIEMALHQPLIRGLLGCKSDNMRFTGKPYCFMAGE